MMTKYRLVLVCAAAGWSLLSSRATADEVKIDAETFGGLEARSIGPAAMGGRIAALDAVPGDRLTIYVGAAGGGVWKSADGGVRFKPIFDKHTQSIGAVTVDPNNPKVLWVGTGESWIRNTVSVGDGVYKSTDGGDNWQRMGLPESEHIARIVVHPKNGDNVFVCATGHAFDDHPERGVFRTKDGGKNWEKVLSVGPDTGCADLAMDPGNPQILYAGMWEFRRKPYFFTSGGAKSGFYKSTDGGSTWTPLKKGPPTGDMGRIAIAVSPAKTSVVYATIESKDTSLYRSLDQGGTWTRMSDASAVAGRPFYFSRLVADPNNVDRVYKCGFSLSVSDDGGKTWSGVGEGGGFFGPNYHGDIHAVWVNPKNSEQLVIGTDGGVYVSNDRGAHWLFAGGLPVSQFYHVSYDMEWPYNVVGGLQDNSTWYGPSRRPGPITNKHWSALAPGDGFWAFVDPDDSDIVYNEIQGGHLFRMSKSTGETRDIRPTPKAGEPKYRFNWNTPIHMSPNEKGTLYYGSQFLFRSRDKGASWERISPDLTTNDPAKQKQDDSGGLTLDNSTAENHCTIFAIAESPKNGRILWVGTDDGNVQISRDGGKTWSNVVANVPGLPRNTWVSSIQASAFDEATAYATFDGHMTGDMKTYVYRTADYGKTWRTLATADLRGYAHVVREDLVSPNLLFLGTEFGLFASLDGGKQWGQFTAGLPNVAVRDVVIHPREQDLLIATHGRGIYIVDDITPLRKLTPEVLSADVAFLESRPSVMVIPSLEFGFNGDGDFEGRSPAEAAAITYYLKRRHLFGDLKLEIYDAKGVLLSTLPGSKRRGINRVFWPMREKPPKVPPAAGIIPSFFALVGPRAPQGTYTVKLIKGKDSLRSEVRLTPDPRAKYSAKDRELQQEIVRKLYVLMGRLTYTVETITDARDQARARAEKLGQGDRLRKQLETLADTLEKQRVALVATKEGEGISGEEKLREELGTLYGDVNGYDGLPTASQINRMGVLSGDLDAALDKFNATAAKEFPPVNALLAKQKLDRLVKLTEVEWGKRGEEK
jgi:photosystem II stability/assembly factor-like uncharacterized protein